MRVALRLLTIFIILLLPLTSPAFGHDGEGRDNWSHQPCQHKLNLPEDKRQLLHSTMKKVFEQDKALVKELHTLHKERHDVVMAEAFDAEKFVAISSRIEKIRDRLQNDKVKAFASIAGRFTPEEREAVIKMHHHRHRNDGRREGWDHGHEWHQHEMNPGSSGGAQEDPRAYPPYPPR